MEPKFVQRGEIKLVGLPYYGNPEGGGFSQAWERFSAAESLIQNKINSKVGYGVEIYPPEMQEKHLWYYMAAMEVEEFGPIPYYLWTKVLPARTYAVFTARGGLSKLGEAFGFIYSQWLPNSGYEVDAFDFEYYDERFNMSDPEHCEIDIYIPIKPK